MATARVAAPAAIMDAPVLGAYGAAAAVGAVRASKVLANSLTPYFHFWTAPALGVPAGMTPDWNIMK